MWTRCRRHARAGHDRDECLNTDTVATRRPADAAASSRVIRARVVGSRDREIARSRGREIACTRTLFLSLLMDGWMDGERRAARTFLRPGAWSPWKSFPAFRETIVHYRLPYQRSTSTFTATYATQHIITITIPNAAGCGHRGRLTTNHRPSAMANDMSLLSITGE